MKYIIILCAIFILIFSLNKCISNDYNKEPNIDNSVSNANYSTEYKEEDYITDFQNSTFNYNKNVEIKTSFEYDEFYIGKPTELRIKIVAISEDIIDIPVEIRFPNYNFYEIVTIDEKVKEDKQLLYNAIITTSTEDNPKENIFVFTIKFKEAKDININLNFPPKYSEYNCKEYIKGKEYDLTFDTLITAAEKDFTLGTATGKNDNVFKKGDTIYLQVSIAAQSINEDIKTHDTPVAIYIPNSSDYDVEFVEGTIKDYITNKNNILSSTLKDELDIIYSNLTSIGIYNVFDMFSRNELISLINSYSSYSNNIRNYLLNKHYKHDSFIVSTISHYGNYNTNNFKLKIKTKEPTTISIYVKYPEEYKKHNYQANYIVRKKKFFFF